MKISDLNQLPTQEVRHNPNISKRVMLAPGDLNHLTNFSQAVFPPGECAPAHHHEDMAEVFFIESGSGLIHIDGNEYILKPGRCILVQAGESHELVNTGNVDLVVSYFGILV